MYIKKVKNTCQVTIRHSRATETVKTQKEVSESSLKFILINENIYFERIPHPLQVPSGNYKPQQEASSGFRVWPTSILQKV